LRISAGLGAGRWSKIQDRVGRTKTIGAKPKLDVLASYSAAMPKSAKRGEPQIFLFCVTL
jgi:hypothetical protein